MCLPVVTRSQDTRTEYNKALFLRGVALGGVARIPMLKIQPIHVNILFVPWDPIGETVDFCLVPETTL